MKLRKGPKAIVILLMLVVLVLLGLIIYNNFFANKDVQEVTVVDEMKDFGYVLKDNKNETYKKMFYELKDILSEKNIDYDKYAEQIAKMYIYDFYGLEDKAAKNDIGGVDFIHPDALENFLENAENTYYKYVESNIYGNRNQELPLVNEITIQDHTTTSFTYSKGTDNEAHKLVITWDYTDSSFDSYQKDVTIIIVQEDKKLYIVEA